jgi:predicted RNA-binding Zn ribbon-like protein
MTHARFRLDNDVLSFRFTATWIDRSKHSRELLVSADDVREWLTLHDLPVNKILEGEVPVVRALREAIHRAGTAIASGKQAARTDTVAINTAAVTGRARRQLTRDGRRQWHADGGLTLADALGVLAEDAIETYSAQSDRIKACEDAACHGLFLDSSRARNRRWCSMNFCGNRNKKLNSRHGS